MFWIVIYVQNLRWLSKVDDTTMIISAKIFILMHCLMNVYANVKVITLSESFTFCITFLLFVLPVSSGSSKSLKVCFFNPTFMRWTRVFKQNPWDFQFFFGTGSQRLYLFSSYCRDAYKSNVIWMHGKLFLCRFSQDKFHFWQKDHGLSILEERKY